MLLDRLVYKLAHVEILGICAVLIAAFWVQFVQGEYPCPLCLIQRMAMMLCVMGPAMVIVEGMDEDVIRVDTLAAGYGLSVLAAVLGLLVSSRQVLLHLNKKTPAYVDHFVGSTGYGSSVFGLHLYSWADIVFLVVIFTSGLTLVASRWMHRVSTPGYPKLTRLTFWILGLIILANAISAFALGGFHWFLPDNPEAYRLFGG